VNAGARREPGARGRLPARRHLHRSGWGPRTPLGAGPSLGATGLPRAGARRAPAGSAPVTPTPRRAPYAVQVSVTDKDGGTGVDQATVTVQASPPPNQAPRPMPAGLRRRRDRRLQRWSVERPGQQPAAHLRLELSATRRLGRRRDAQPHYRNGGELHVTLVVTDALARDARRPVDAGVTITNVAPWSRPRLGRSSAGSSRRVPVAAVAEVPGEVAAGCCPGRSTLHR